MAVVDLPTVTHWAWLLVHHSFMHTCFLLHSYTC